MNQRIIINTTNLKMGGALQVAVSFIEEAAKYPGIDFYVILGAASAKVVLREDFKQYMHIHFEQVNISPTRSVLSFVQFGQAMKRLERRIKPDGVITVFGPCYWKPKAPHIMGFANGYLVYKDTYFFKTWQGWKRPAYRLKNAIYRWLLKREAAYYWTETESSKAGLLKITHVPFANIVVASNNCSHFFRADNYAAFNSLPLKKGLRLLYLSSYYRHKGFELTPAVLNKLKVAGVNIELIVTIEEEEYKRIFEGFDNVINLGSVHPQYCPDIYRQCDIVFVPTLLETFTAIYPEAMYMQKPIVTTDLPFAHNICGDAALYFNPALAEDAAGKIQQVLNDTSLRKRLIANGLEQLEKFDLPEERFKKILNMLLENAEACF